MVDKYDDFDDIKFSGELLDTIIKGFLDEDPPKTPEPKKEPPSKWTTLPVSALEAEEEAKKGIYKLKNHAEDLDKLKEFIEGEDIVINKDNILKFNEIIKTIKEAHPGTPIKIESIKIENNISKTKDILDLTDLIIGTLEIKNSQISIDVSGTTLGKFNLDKVAFPIFAYDNTSKIALVEEVANITINNPSKTFGHESVTILDLKNTSKNNDLTKTAETPGYDLLKNRFPYGLGNIRKTIEGKIKIEAENIESVVNVIREPAANDPALNNSEELTKEEKKLQKLNEEAERETQEATFTKVVQNIKTLAKEKIKEKEEQAKIERKAERKERFSVFDAENGIQKNPGTFTKPIIGNCKGGQHM